MTEQEIEYIGESLKEVIKNAENWQSEYEFDINTGDFIAKNEDNFEIDLTNIFN